MLEESGGNRLSVMQPTSPAYISALPIVSKMPVQIRRKEEVDVNGYDIHNLHGRPVRVENDA